MIESGVDKFFSQKKERGTKGRKDEKKSGKDLVQKALKVEN